VPRSDAGRMGQSQKVELLTLLSSVSPPVERRGAAPEPAPATSHEGAPQPATAADPGLPGGWLAALEAYESASLIMGDVPREQRVSMAMVEAIDRFQDLPEDLLVLTLIAFARARGEA